MKPELLENRTKVQWQYRDPQKSRGLRPGVVEGWPWSSPDSPDGVANMIRIKVSLADKENGETARDFKLSDIYLYHMQPV